MSTEAVDPRYLDVDSWPTPIAVAAMLEGQLAAVASLSSQTGTIAAAAEAGAPRLLRSGRLVYCGAGTSGRIAVQDGVELAPTYNWPEDRLVFLVAGGLAALSGSVEGAEDNIAKGRDAVAENNIGPDDIVIGVAASGRTPFTIAVIEAARERGALTIAIANNADAPLLAAAEHRILADTGAEVVAGSTRMKAGTAQKVALNLLSTAMMLRCGLVYRGMMVNMRVSNEKLSDRARKMVARIARVDIATAAAALDATGNDIKQAALVARGFTRDDAAVRLREAGSDLRRALDDGDDGER